MTIAPTTIFDGQLTIYQPTEGYRFAIDPIFLGAFVPVKPGESVLDLGTGVGTVACCLLYRVPMIHVTGMDVLEQMINIAKKNAQTNGFESSFSGIVGRVGHTAIDTQYDHIVMNPPYYAPHAHRPSRHSLSHIANHETTPLSTWITYAHSLLKHRGSLCLVLPTERLQEILTLLCVKYGTTEIYPLWTKQGRKAKRVLIRTIKGGRGQTTLYGGMVIHHDNGDYTKEARAILYHGHAISPMP